MIAAAVIAAFKARCEASARRYAAGEIDLHDIRAGVDALLAHAVATGVVAAIGVDAVQAIMGQAFREVRS